MGPGSDAVCVMHNSDSASFKVWSHSLNSWWRVTRCLVHMGHLYHDDLCHYIVCKDVLLLNKGLDMTLTDSFKEGWKLPGLNMHKLANIHSCLYFLRTELWFLLNPEKSVWPKREKESLLHRERPCLLWCRETTFMSMSFLQFQDEYHPEDRIRVCIVSLNYSMPCWDLDSVSE